MAFTSKSRIVLLGASCAALLLILAANHLKATPALSGNDTRAADLKAIEKLHQQDVAATLSGDSQALADLFTDDAVLLEPGSPAVIGKAAILGENQKQKAAHPASKVTKYQPDIKDTQLLEGWAFEWAYFDGSYQETDKSPVQSFRGKSLRIVRREPDGSWKFARVMWNVAEDKGPGPLNCSFTARKKT